MTIHSLAKNFIRRVPCPECGVSRVISRVTEWTADGVILNHLLGFEPPPAVMFEVEEYRNIFASLEEAIGFNIEHIVTEGDRKSIKIWSANMVGLVPPFMLRTRFMSRLLIEIYMLIACLAGLGNQDTARIKPGSYVLFYGENLYYLPSALGDRWGYTELLFGSPCSARAVDLGDERSVTACVRSEEPSELEERLEIPPRERIPGTVEFERCSRCGVPISVSHYRWDYDRGVITNTLNGLRECMMPGWTIPALYHGLTEELGEELPGLIIEAEKDFTARRVKEFGLRLSHSGETDLRDDPSENMKILLADFPFRGWGNPVDFSLENEALRLRVNNPFNEALVCGKVLGYYESLLDRKGKLEWTMPPEEWVVEISIKPG